MLMDRGTVRNM